MPCHRSGECCRKVAFTVAPKPDMLELLEAWGIIDKGQKQLTLIIWQDCQHWNQDTRLCEIYENRPKICREFLCARAQNRLSVPVKVEGAQ